MAAHPLIECVPNFSEGRRPQVVDQIADAIRGVPGAHVLDIQMDADHHRSVITFAGSPQAVEEAAFQAVARAAQLINLDEHSGQHPRMGATDVLPFIPLQDASMAECVAIARRVGQRIGDTLGIPIYLYEAAATRPERVNLADVRRGEYEGIRAEMDDPRRTPDFGPRHVGPAGATAVGARAPLIAYNIYLGTSDISIAKKIARVVRHSSGGLRFVKALGMDVAGRAQVSMNLTDYTQTALHRVYEMVRVEAERYGVAVVESEVIGLIPQAALWEAAEHYLRLNRFKRTQVLEHQLAGVPDPSPVGFVEAVASATPTPGGGSVTALVGALAAALAEMAAGLTVGRPKYSEVEGELQSLRKTAAYLRDQMLTLVDADAAAYQRVLLAYRLPRATEADRVQREQAIQTALLGAAEPPLAVAQSALDALRLLVRVAAIGNPNVRTDAQVGALLAEAAIRGAALNVRVNVGHVTDTPAADRLRQAVADLTSTARMLVADMGNEG